MQGQFNLGVPEGPLRSRMAADPGIQRLVNALRFAAAFELEIVACPTPLHARILVRWLEEQIPELDPITPLAVPLDSPQRAAVNDRHGGAMAELLLAGILLATGRDAVALKMLLECAMTFQRFGDVRHRSIALSMAAFAHARQGELDAALQLVREPHADPEAVTVAVSRLQTLTRLLIARGEPEDLEEAERHLRHAVMLARSMSQLIAEDLRAWLVEREGGATGRASAIPGEVRQSASPRPEHDGVPGA